MCGRYSLFRIAELLEQYSLRLPEGPTPRYNIAPGQPVLAITSGPPYEGDWFQWGLIPFWAREGFRGLINARAETVAEKPSFRRSFAQRRCLIPADGFYEWTREGALKQPYHFSLSDRSVFCFAGLWDRWTQADGRAILSCTIMTTRANPVVETIHDRMPVIVSRADEGRWLNPETPASELSGILSTYPAVSMQKARVSARLNSPGNDSTDLLTPE